MNNRQRELSFRLMSELNMRNLQGTDIYFDCGEYGILHIWWDSGKWKNEVITLKDASFWFALDAQTIEVLPSHLRGGGDD